MTLLAEATRDIEAGGVVEVLANGLVLTLVPADKAATDDRYSKEMCPQFVELICSNMSEIFRKPKRERCRVKKRPPVARRILPAMSCAREHRSAPRREGGARAGSSASADDGGGSSDSPPPQRTDSVTDGGVNPASARLPRSDRVLERRARP